MLRWHVDARYDVWARCWRVTDSNPPGLELAAPTKESLRGMVEARCHDSASGGPYELRMTTTKQMWTLSSPLFASMLTNGRRVTKRLANELRARFTAA